MTVQTSVANNPAAGKPGLLFGGMGKFDSYVNGEASASISPGVVVAAGTADDEVIQPNATTVTPVGVFAFSHHLNDNTNLIKADANEPVSVLREGDVWVQPEDTVAKGGPVYFRVIAPGAEVLGSLRSDADGGNAVRLPGAYWYSDGTSSTPAIARLAKDPRLAEAESLDQVVLPDSNASLTADTTNAAKYVVPAGKTFILESVIGYNATGLAQDGTNYFNIKVQNSGATKVAANWSTETGQEGTITAATPFTFTNGTLANRTFDAGEQIDVLYDETGTATLPAGSLTITGRLV
jgi:hypothetical protein